MRLKLEIAGAVLAVLLLASVLYAAHRSSLDRAEASGEARVHSALAAEREKQNQTLTSQQAARDAASEKAQQALQAQIDGLRSALAARPVVEKMTGSPVATVAAKDLPEAVRASLPSSPSYSVLTEAQTIEAAKFKLRCDVTGEQLGTCSKDLTDERAKTANLTKSLEDAKKDAANWKRAAAGGSFLNRVGRGIKHATCGGGATATGIVASRKDPATALAAGVATFGLCELLVH